MVLATYLCYKLTNKLGTPSYHLDGGGGGGFPICITILLVMLQRRLMRTATALSP